MKEYHKIQTVFKRDAKGKIIHGSYTLPEFEYLKHNLWVATEKVDGTNIRIMYQDGQITFGGKTDNASIPAPLFKVLQETFLPKLALFQSAFGESEVCFYGEGYGAKIQKGGGNYRPDNGFVLFDIKIGEWWLSREDIKDISIKFDIDIVPIVACDDLEHLILMAAEGFQSQWGNFLAEGIVAKPGIEFFTRKKERIITKIKYKDFNLNGA